MNKNILMLIFVGLFLISFVSASLGIFKQTECVNIVTNLNSEAVNISVLTDPTPNPTILIQNEGMIKNGTLFSYNFCDTTKTGTYTYGYCDNNGNCYSNDFEVTPSGYGGSSGIAFFIFMIVFIYAITFIGLFSRNIPITILGGMTMIFLGVYMINNGIIIYRDDLTLYFSYLTSFIGAFISIWAGIEYIQENI